MVRGLVWEDVKQDLLFGVKERSSFVQFAVDFSQFCFFLEILNFDLQLDLLCFPMCLDDCNACDL